MPTAIARYLNPWKFRRERDAEMLQALRRRDGDACARCRRPLRFDLPAGHDQGARVEPIVPGGAGGAIDNLCLCHGRCNTGQPVDLTGEVAERMRRKAEAELFAKSRRKKRKAA